jgi:hypothetical protein
MPAVYWLVNSAGLNNGRYLRADRKPPDPSRWCLHRNFRRLYYSRWYRLFFFAGRGQIERHYDQYKIRIGRSLLLGLEVLVAADIVKTIAIQLTFTSLGLLVGLVLVRTFLRGILVLEIEGRWPWRRELSPMNVVREGVDRVR